MSLGLGLGLGLGRRSGVADGPAIGFDDGTLILTHTGLLISFGRVLAKSDLPTPIGYDDGTLIAFDDNTLICI